MLRHVVAALTVAAVMPHVAHACSCGRIASASEAHEYSSVVFEGTVVSKRIVLGATTLGAEEWFGPLEEYSFAVTRSWKGPAVPELRLRQGYDNCDNTFSGGETYLVFASINHEDSSAYSSGKCGPTTHITSVARHIAELGPSATALAVSRRPLASLNAAYFARLYFWSGVAAQLNMIRHVQNIYAWRAVGIGAICLIIGAVLSALASAVLLARRRRRALAATVLVLALGLAASSVFASGASLLRSGFYAHYKEWKP